MMKTQVLEANRRLATAMGWTNIIDAGGALMGSPPWMSPHSRGQAQVPNWAGDWKECGPLMVKYSCYPAVDTANPDILFAYFGEANHHGQHEYEFVYVEKHTDADAAARAVVVAAVSREIEARQ